jgi:Tol biopolymer transport system component
MFRIASAFGVAGATLWFLSRLGATTAASESGSADSARIAFGSHRDGNWEVFVTDADGRNQTRLTRRNGHTRFPLWSPDRTRIAFATQIGDAAEGWDFWVMKADGTGARRLCSGLVAKSGREWSPDGGRIAITRVVDGNVDVYVIEGATGRLSRLTTSANVDRDPTWSPDGVHIAFTSERDGNWSPDGERLLFVSARTGTAELHLMNVDDLQVVQLTNRAHSSSDVPRWSPDGSLIAFQIAQGARYDIGVLRLRDRQQKVLVGTPHNDGSYSWSPDGRRLAYISGPGGRENLYVIDVESARTTQLTTTWSLTPSWTR